MAASRIDALPQWHQYLIARLKEARKDRSLSGRALGEKAGITQTEISYYETGKREPSLARLYKLSTALDIDIHHLLQARADSEF